MAEIAYRSRFSGQSHMSRRFKDATEETSGAIRAEAGAPKKPR